MITTRWHRLLLCRGHVNLAWLGQHEQNSHCAFDAMYTVLLMSLVVIPREEAYLEARFPSEYLPYKKSVRRWF